MNFQVYTLSLFFRLTDNPYYDYKIGDSTLYAYWAGSVIGPFVCILAVAHALLWGFPSAIVGSIVSYTIVTCIVNIYYILVVSNSAIVTYSYTCECHI